MSREPLPNLLHLNNFTFSNCKIFNYDDTLLKGIAQLSFSASQKFTTAHVITQRKYLEFKHKSVYVFMYVYTHIQYTHTHTHFKQKYL